MNYKTVGFGGGELKFKEYFDGVSGRMVRRFIRQRRPRTPMYEIDHEQEERVQRLERDILNSSK